MVYFVMWLLIGLYITSSTALKRRAREPNLWIWNKTEFINPNGKIFENYHSPPPNKSSFYDVMKGTVVQVIVDNMDPYIKYDSNNSELGGYLGHTWNTIQGVLKFTSNITYIKGYVAARDMIKRYESDVFLAAVVYTKRTTNVHFSQPYFRNWYHLYLKEPNRTPAYNLHFLAFDADLWLTLFMFFALATLSLWSTCLILRKLVPKAEVLLSIPTYFMGLISAFLNTGYDLKLRSCAARLQVFTALIFGVLCYYALSASLVANLVLENPLPFATLEEVAHQNTYSLCLRDVSFVYDNFTDSNGNLLPQWQDKVNTDRCPKYTDWRSISGSICHENIVFLENRILMAQALPYAQCQVALISNRYFATGNYIIFSKKFKDQKAIRIMMTKMRSVGVSQKLESTWVKKEIPNYQSMNEVKQITFAHVRGLILIYLALIGFSLFVLVLEICFENVYFKWIARKYQKYDLKIKKVVHNNV